MELLNDLLRFKQFRKASQLAKCCWWQTRWENDTLHQEYEINT